MSPRLLHCEITGPQGVVNEAVGTQLKIFSICVLLVDGDLRTNKLKSPHWTHVVLIRLRGGAVLKPLVEALEPRAVRVVLRRTPVVIRFSLNLRLNPNPRA